MPGRTCSSTSVASRTAATTRTSAATPWPWWRCHRRIVADAAALLRGLDVADLAHTGKVTQHEPSAGVRVVDGLLRYDGSADA